MGITITLDNDLINTARSYSTESCSVSKQIEHWAKIGRIAEDNPNLSYRIIKDILLGLDDVKLGNTEEYRPSMLSS